MWYILPVALASLSIVDEKPSVIILCINVIALVSKLELFKYKNKDIIKIVIRKIVKIKLNLFLNIKIIVVEKTKQEITVID